MRNLVLSSILVCIITSCGTAIENEVKQLEKNGVVVEKYESQIGCHGNIIIRNNKVLDSLTGLCYCVPRANQAVWKYIETGDSLVKKRNSLEIVIYRKGSKLAFEYPICVQ